MKLLYSQFNAPLEFDEGMFNSLIIENPSMFLETVQDFYSQINGNEGKSVLSLNDNPVEFSKNAELITSFVPFEINRKSLVNKLLSSMEKQANDESNLLKTSQLLADIENFITDLSMDYSFDICCEKISVGSLLKSAGICIKEKSSDILDNISDYMEMVLEFENDKLFIFVNMRSYFSLEKLNQFLKSAVLHKYKILLLDNKEYGRLDFENRTVIDNDLCEI